MLEISAFNNKKQKEYNKFVGKRFSMNDKLYLGLNVELNFDNETLKAKLENVEKEKEVNVDKKIVMTTNNFTCLFQLASAYDNNKED